MSSAFPGEFGVWLGVGISGAVLGLLALIFLAIGWFQARGARAAGTWSTTGGEVMEATVESYLHHSSEGGTMTAYRPRITYGYTVNGREYVGDRLNFGTGVHSSIRSFAENKARQYPTGSQVQVLYDPQNPNEAVLERSSPSSRIFYVIGLIMLVAAIGVCVLGVGLNSFIGRLL